MVNGERVRFTMHRLTFTIQMPEMFKIWFSFTIEKMKRGLILAILWLFFLLGCGGGGEGRGETAVSDSDLGCIIFIEIEEGNQYLSQYDLQTEQITRLFTVPDNAWISHTAVSPNSAEPLIAYAPEPPPGEIQFGYTGLYQLQDGQPVEIIPRQQPEEIYFNPIFSPDGAFIYYSHIVPLEERAGQFINQLQRRHLQTGESETVAKDAIWPRLSPDGSHLVFVTIDPIDLANALYIANANGENARELISGDVFQVIDVPMFSPDGAWIYFSAAERSEVTRHWWEWLMGIEVVAAHNIPSDWWRVAVDDGSLERLTSLNEVGLYGEFVLDGRFIIFSAVSGLYQMSPDGSQITRLVQTTAAPSLSWVQK